MAIPYLWVEDLVVGENGVATFHVRLNAVSGSPITVDYMTADLTALAGSDYTAQTGSLTFAPGETDKTVTVQITNDNVAEIAKGFQLVLTNPVNAVLDPSRDSGIATLIDDDNTGAASPTVTVADVSVDRSAGTATFAVYLSQPAKNTVTVHYNTADGTALAGSDYTARTGNLSFAAGEVVKYVTVPIVNDGLPHADETFTLNLSNPSGIDAAHSDLTGTATITNDQATLNTGFISVDNPTAVISDGYVYFTVRLDQPAASDLQLSYYTIDGTAASGTNYVGVASDKAIAFTIAAGQTTAIISVPVINQPIPAGSEYFSLVVTGTVGNTTGGVSGTATVVNDQQVAKAIDDNLTLSEDQAISFNVFDNDFNPQHHNLLVVEVSTSAGHSGVPPVGHESATFTTTNGGTVVIDPQGNVSYTPATNYVGTDSFSYQFIDAGDTATAPINGLTSTATVTFTVSNGTPTAVNDTASTQQNQSVQIHILDNDADPNGDLKDSQNKPLLDSNGQPLTPTISTAPAHGAATVDPTTGVVTYTPFANYFGTDQFTYTIKDFLGHSSSATVSVNVTDTGAVVAVDDNITIAQDQATSINILQNDLHPAGEIITIIGLGGGSSTDLLVMPQPGEAIFSTTNGGKVVIDSNGLGSYIPASGYVGTDSFTYVLRSSQGALSTATVNITVTDAKPVAINDSAATGQNTLVAIDVLTNDSDPNHDLTTFPLLATAPTHGTVVVDTDPTSPTYRQFLYTPSLDYFGTDQFTYTVKDALGHAATATVNLNVVGDGSLQADDDFVQVSQDQTANLSVLQNDSNPHNTTLTVISVNGENVVAAGSTITTANDGIVTLDSHGIGTYTPAPTFVGTDSFTYTFQSSAGVTSTATVHITVANGTPTAVDDSRTTTLGTAVAIAVLANDSDPNGDLLSAGNPVNPITTTAPSHGTASVDPTTGVVTYTPNAHFYGADSFTYTIKDLRGHTSTATVYLNVDNAGLPTAHNDIGVTVQEDQPATLDVLGNDDNPNHDTLTISATSTPAHGTVAINGDKTSLVYIPASNYHGTDSFTYTLTDSQGYTSTATVALTVVDGTPVAGNYNLTTTANQPGSLNVLGAATTDPNGDALSLTGVAKPAHGSVTFNKDGTVSYTPDAGYAGADSFTYTASDGLHSATGLVNITVTNATPTATNDTATTRVDQAVLIPVLGNDSDINSDSLTVTAVTNGSHGTATVDANGIVTYTPDAQFVGTDSFTYTLSDGNNHFVPATVTVTVTNSGPGKPVVVSDTAHTIQDQAVVIDVLANDSDPEHDPLKVVAVTAGAHGTVEINADGSLTYTPTAGYFSATPDSFTYTVSDGQGHTTVGTVGVTIENGTPTAQDDSANVGENGTVVVNVLANDSDPQHDALTIASKTDGTHGKVIISGGSLIYTPDKDFFGTDSFTYTVSDSATAGQGRTSTATVSVTITNAPPVAVADTVSTNINQAALITVLSNDADPENDTLTVSAGTNPAHGTVKINDDGTITYTPDGKFVGDDTFTYTLGDGNNHFVTGSVTVTITNSGPNPPTVVNDSAATSQDKAVNIDVLGNDSDLDGDPLTVTATSRPAHGTVKIETDGSLTYTPAAGYSSTTPDSFTYTVSDGQGHTSQGRVEVTIANGTPTAQDDSRSVDENGSVNIPVLDNDSDPQNDTLTITKAGDGTGTTSQGGKVTINAGVITYTPKAGFHGNDSFSYTISDSLGHTAAATVSVTVVNNPPTAQDDTVSTRVDETVKIKALGNDTDPEDQDALAVTTFSAPAHGTLSLGDDGVFTYTPTTQYAGTDSFTYTITDGQGHFATATVAISVDNTGPGVPVATADNATTSQDKDVTIAVLANDTDPENDTLTVTATSLPAHGTVKINDDGTLAYTPTAGYFSTTPDSFTYTVSDGQGHTSTGTVNVTIEDGTPVANDVTLDVPQNNTVNVRLGKSVSDPQNDPLTFSSGTDPSHGKVDYSAGDTVTYTPESGFTGQDQFTYIVSDGIHTATATVTINVVNRAPTAADDSASTGVDKPVDIQVLANDSDPDSDALSVVPGQITQPQHGTVALNTGVITYTPDSQYVGSDSFTYTISDGKGHQATATVNVSVTNTGPGVPVAAPDNVETKQNTAIAIGVLDNDTDPEGDALIVTKVSAPDNGTVALGAGGVVTYTPKTGYFGTDSFTYTVSDGQGHASVGTVNVTVDNSGPGAPVVTDDSATTDEDVPVTIKALQNDSDPEGDTLTIVGVADPANGTATAGNGGIVTYKPDAGFVGTDNFTYSVSDGQGHTSVGSITVTVDSGAPVALDDSAVTGQNQTVSIDVLANDSDPQGDFIFVSNVSDPSHGRLVVGLDDTIIYTPDTGYIGKDSFLYRVSDSLGHTNVGSVSLQVNGPPTLAAQLQDQSATPNNFFQFQVPGGTFQDAAGDPLTYSARQADGSALPGWLVFDPASRTFRGTPTNSDAGASLSITVTAIDALFPTLSASDTFVLQVAAATSGTPVQTGSNQAPTGTDNSASVTEGGAYVFDSADFPFTDPDQGDNLQAVLIDSLPAEGRLLLDGQAVHSGQAIAVADIDDGLLSYQAPDVLSGNLAQGFAFKVGDGQTFSASDNQYTLTLTPTSGAGQTVGGNGQAIGKKTADTLLGDANANLLNGKGGNDLLYGGGGADTLKGGAGSDLLSGGAGDDKLLGQAGRDTLIGGEGNDFLDGGAGKDIYRYLADALGTDDLIGGFHDVIKATPGDAIDFSDAVWAGFLNQGSALGSGLLAKSLGQGTNIAFDGHTLQIDVDGNGQFGAGQDFAITLVGVHKVVVDAGNTLLTLG
ncbi:CshA-type fibril repeat-containing protein [Methylomagnum ishizawai]|uniref:CshA-type fibril repeat-containing protein n=1 Tax=Methylomagnum ishizawai TaxID=1760988 RepID=A0A1Y6CVL9_9GAMM|nr:Ig-like domain-containing protein [Methylomagnum ishizawai]SMF94270.1 CshA-type fibril repeat-containing protein [Methylomagnum ishizawai]